MGKRRGRRAIGLAAALAALTLGATAGTALAHKQQAGSFLELSPTAVSETAIQYTGRVNSAVKSCGAGRAVDLFVAGNLLATVTTDRAGNWSLSGTRPPRGTDVTATIPRKVKRSRRHRHICGGDSLSKKAP